MTFTTTAGAPDWKDETLSSGLSEVDFSTLSRTPPIKLLGNDEVYFYKNNNRFYIRRGGYHSVRIDADEDNNTFKFLVRNIGETITINGYPDTILDITNCEGPNAPECTSNKPTISVAYANGFTSSVRLRVHRGKPSYIPSSRSPAFGGGSISIPGWGRSIRTVTFSHSLFKDVKVDFAVDYRCDRDSDGKRTNCGYRVSAWKSDSQ